MDPPGDHEKQKFGRNGILMFRKSHANAGRSRNKRMDESSIGSNIPNAGGNTTSGTIVTEEGNDDGGDDSSSFVRVMPPPPLPPHPNNNNKKFDEIVEQQKQLLAQAASHYNQRIEEQQQRQLQQQQQQHNHHNHQQQRKSMGMHKKAASLSSYQTTPITKHYEVSRQILSAFDSHWGNSLWVTAYAVGVQFIETALLEIPKHGYFYSKRHERERMESSLEAARVAHMLQELLMHDHEQKEETAATKAVVDEKGVVEPVAGLVPNGDLPRVQKLLGLALEQVEQASSDQEEKAAQQRAYQVSRAEVEEELRGESDWVVCEPLLACSESLASVCGGGGGGGGPGGGTGTSFVSVGSPSNKSTVTERNSVMSIDTGVNTTTTNDFPNPPRLSRGGSGFIKPNAGGSIVKVRSAPVDNSFSLVTQPPSLIQDRSTCGSVSSATAMDELLLEKALYLSGLEISMATEVGYDNNRREPPPDADVDDVGNHRQPQQQTTTTPSLELSTLAQLYHEDFDSLQKTRRVRISFADTFQGRLPESTNGCTVIAPLLSIHHLVSELTDFHYETGGDPGLPDTAVEQCIDMETPVVLSDLRQRLGLSEHAFLIPADAHDYLIEHGQLSQSQFQTVSGGNILDDGHLQNFVKALEKADNRKIAATLFFHEHVVAILKLKRVGKGGKVTYWYDFIDSLPLKETLRRCNETPSDLCQRMGLFVNMTEEEVARENEMTALPRTARIRCLDAEALTAVIRWYACSKFTEENISYIDQYPWDDAASDFDPRVFQAFVWGGTELQ